MILDIIRWVIVFRIDGMILGGEDEESLGAQKNMLKMRRTGIFYVYTRRSPIPLAHCEGFEFLA